MFAVCRHTWKLLCALTCRNSLPWWLFIPFHFGNIVSHSYRMSLFVFKCIWRPARCDSVPTVRVSPRYLHRKQTSLSYHIWISWFMSLTCLAVSDFDRHHRSSCSCHHSGWQLSVDVHFQSLHHNSVIHCHLTSNHHLLLCLFFINV